MIYMQLIPYLKYINIDLLIFNIYIYIYIYIHIKYM